VTGGSLARRNVRRNLSDYAAYFACLVFVVVSLYSFAAIYANEQFAQAAGGDTKIFMLFLISAIIVAVFGISFTWSSAGFFLKRRSGELATYSLLGLKRSQISRMLFAENCSIGGAALVAGLAAGILLSRLLELILAAMMRMPVEIGFRFSPWAAVFTTGLFALVFVASALRSSAFVRRSKLIDLFKAEKDAERPPRSSLVPALGCLVFLGGGYAGALLSTTINIGAVIFAMIPVLLATIIGTYFLFSGLVPGALALFSRNKSRLYDGYKLVAYTQLRFRTRRNSRMLATIAILDAVAMSAVSTAAGVYSSAFQSISQQLEYSYEFESGDPADLASALAVADGGVASSLSFVLLEPEATLPSGKVATIQLMRLSDYRLRLQGRRAEGSAVPSGLDRPLGRGEAIRVYSGPPRSKATGESTEVFSIGRGLDYRVVAVDTRAVSSVGKARTLIVVGDEAWGQAASRFPDSRRREIVGISLKKPSGSYELTSRIGSALGPRAKDFVAFSDYEKNFYATTGILLFIGVFLSLLFFLAACATIGFKQVVDAKDDAARFSMLRKLGLSAKDARECVGLQLRFVFALPLIAGLTHSLFAMRMLESLVNGSIWPGVAICLGAYIIFSLLFYRVTLSSYLSMLERGAEARRA
jgi:putative ABC transport system permease protein